MQIKVQRIEDGPAKVEVIDPTDGAIAHSIDLNAGDEVVINAPTAASPADVEVGEVTPIATAGQGTEGTEALAEDAGTTDEGATGTTEPPPPASGEPVAGDAASGTEGNDTPTTSAISGLPLYRVLADTVPDGFIQTSLKTPDGFSLYTYDGDSADQPHTAEIGEGDQVALYAEGDDDEKPVVSTIEGAPDQAA